MLTGEKGITAHLGEGGDLQAGWMMSYYLKHVYHLDTVGLLGANQRVSQSINWSQFLSIIGSYFPRSD